MMYSWVVLVVSGVLAALTSAKDGLLTSVGELEAVRDDNGVAQCATSPPNKTVSARSKIDCMRVCLSQGCACEFGANYHTDDRTCQLYLELPDSLEQVPNCIYYQVLILDYCKLCVHLSSKIWIKQNNNKGVNKRHNARRPTAGAVKIYSTPLPLFNGNISVAHCMPLSTRLKGSRVMPPNLTSSATCDLDLWPPDVWDWSSHAVALKEDLHWNRFIRFQNIALISW